MKIRFVETGAPTRDSEHQNTHRGLRTRRRRDFAANISRRGNAVRLVRVDAAAMARDSPFTISVDSGCCGLRPVDRLSVKPSPRSDDRRNDSCDVHSSTSHHVQVSRNRLASVLNQLCLRMPDGDAFRNRLNSRGKFRRKSDRTANRNRHLFRLRRTADNVRRYSRSSLPPNLHASRKSGTLAASPP